MSDDLLTYDFVTFNVIVYQYSDAISMHKMYFKKPYISLI